VWRFIAYLVYRLESCPDYIAKTNPEQVRKQAGVISPVAAIAAAESGFHVI
jgi:hypothetical protein